MESLRALLLTIGLAIVITIVALLLFHAYEGSMHSQTLSIVEEVYSAVSTIGTTVLHIDYPICVVNGSNIVSIILPKTSLRLRVPKVAIGSTCCVGTCMIVTSRRTFRLGIGNLTMRPIVTYAPHSNRTRIIIHSGKPREKCSITIHCKQILNIRFISSGFCPVNYSFHIIIQEACVDRNCTYSISILYSPSLAKYIGVFKHTNKSIIIGLEDCSCCDFDKRDEVLNITVLRNMTHIVILQSKGGFSHKLYINGREVYYKPPGVTKYNIAIGSYPMKCIVKKHCYEVCR